MVPSHSEPEPARNDSASLCDRDRVGRVGLELDRVGARLVGGVDELDRDVLVLAVVGRQLGDDVHGVPGADRAAGDAEVCGHVVIPESTASRASIDSTLRSASSAAADLDRRAAALVGEGADPDRPKPGGTRPDEVLARVVADIDGSGRFDREEPAGHPEGGRRRLAVTRTEVVGQDDHVEPRRRSRPVRRACAPGRRRSRRTRRRSARLGGAGRRAARSRRGTGSRRTTWVR